MSQNDFASQLTKLGAAANLDPTDLAVIALRKNRRRIRTLAALTIGLWIIAFLLVPALWMPFAALMKRQIMELSQKMGSSSPITSADVAKVLILVVDHVSKVSGIILAIIILAALLAAVSTVWLVLTVRRVTLEQLSLGLAQVAEQLRRLQNPPA